MNTQSAPPKHTPGPWITSTGRVPNIGRALGVPKDSRKPCEKCESICVVCKEDNTQPHDVANAMLIAASPLMLAALERLEKACNAVHEVSGGTPQHEAMWLAQLEARDAITEATGIPWQNAESIHHEGEKNL